MNKRLFVALSFSNLAQDFEPWMKKIRKTADHKEINLHWTPPQNFHVTLVFLGDTDESQIPEICRRIQTAVAAHPSFKVKIRGIDGFPVLNQARVLYLGVQCNQAILDLQGELENILKAPDKREPNFVPHLTVARLRNPKSCRDLVSPFTHIDLGKQDVSEISLYSSVLRQSQVIYEKIESFSLASPDRNETGLDSVPVF